MDEANSYHSLARNIAEMAVAVDLGKVPAPVIARAKLHILDALGLAIAATVQDFGRTSTAAIARMAGSGSVSVIGHADRIPLRDAALANAILAHGLDFDDTHLASIIHPTCTALPVALAIGEELDRPGSEMLAAFLAGAETGIRLGLAVDGGFHHVGYHATGVVSHFASAVTAGRMLGLDAEQITQAQGIAGSTASGIQVFLEEGAWTKRFHPGWGAVAGYTAACLAREGFKGPTRPYVGKFGLFDTHLPGKTAAAKLDAMAAGLGEHWHFGETALKPYPVCHFIHGCADAAIALHHELGGAPIARVEALLPQPTLHIIAEPAEAKQHPTNEYEAKFSAQFVTAYCLLHGRFGLPDLLPEALADERVLALAARVACREDPDSAFPEYFSGGVRVVLEDGSEHFHHTRINSGAGDRAMDKAAVTGKFRACASLAIADGRAREIEAAVLALEDIGVAELMELLRASGSGG